MVGLILVFGSIAPQTPPTNHPLRPYKTLLGLVHDDEVANLARVSRTTVRNWREALGRELAEALPKEPAQQRIKNCVGPWLGYESLFGTMSAAKISRAVGVPFAIVEQRQNFCMRPGITPCVTKPAATYAAATPQFHSPAASADA